MTNKWQAFTWSGVDQNIFLYPQCPMTSPAYSELNGEASLYPDSKVHGAKMGPIWGRQDPGGPHVGPMNLVIWESLIKKS